MIYPLLADLVLIARASNTVIAAAVKADAPYNNVKEFTEAVRANPGKFNYGAVPGITEFIFWGYQYHEKLDILQVPYRDINVAPVDLGEGRIQAVMASFAIVQPQINAGRIKLFVVNNKTRIAPAPNMPTAREQGVNPNSSIYCAASFSSAALFLINSVAPDCSMTLCFLKSLRMRVIVSREDPSNWAISS